MLAARPVSTGAPFRPGAATDAAALEHFRAVAQGIPQLVWRSCNEGRWIWASPQWQAFTGQDEAASLGQGWLEAVHPDDRAATLLAWEGARAHGALAVEFRLLRAADRSWRWHQTRSLPLRGAPEPGWPEGRILSWLGTCTDIEELRQLQERQAVLVAETQHRTRNLLAVVAAIARRTFGQSEAAAEFQQRLATLGRVQGFLSLNEGGSLDLAELVHAELEVAGQADPQRIRVAGPAVELPAGKAQPVALAVHELATNAMKYGALLQPGARLAVIWRLEGGSGPERLLVLDWRESGVAMPSGGGGHRGYGSELIERALPYQLKATTRLVFGPDGVHCTLELPLGGTPEEAPR